MPIGAAIYWAEGNPLGDPRLAALPQIIHEIRRGVFRHGVRKGTENDGEYLNLDGSLPSRGGKYWKEYHFYPKPEDREENTHRLILGDQGEVYITGSHYRTLRPIIGLPTALTRKR